MQYSNTDQKRGYMLLYRPDVGMIETDNITGRDLGALKQNKEKHSLIGLLDNIRNVTTKLNAARLVTPNTFAWFSSLNYVLDNPNSTNLNVELFMNLTH